MSRASDRAGDEAARALSVLERLAAAQLAIDEHDREFHGPPYDAYDAVLVELDALSLSERAALSAWLDDARPGVRVEVLRAVARLGLTEALAGVERALGDEDASVRDASADALTTLAPEAALRTLVERGVLVSHTVLGRAVDAAVGALGAAALPWVVRSGATPWDAGKRAWRVLLDLDRDGAVAALDAGLACGDALWVLGTASIVRERGGAWALPRFVALARSRDARVSRAAAEALSVIGDATAIEPLLAVIGGPDAWARPAALQALFDVGRRTSTAVSARVLALASQDPIDQAVLLRALAAAVTLPCESASRDAIVAALRPSFAHARASVVAAAVRVATAFRASELTDQVVAALGHPGWYEGDLTEACREFAEALGPPAASALGAAIDAGALPTASDGARAIARGVANLLGKLPALARAQVGPLVRALQSPDVKLQAAAAWSLGCTGAVAARDDLLALAHAGAPGSAYRAVQSLVQLRDPRVVAPALAHLAPILAGAPLAGGDASSLCATSLAALGWAGAQAGSDAGSDAAVEALLRALRHADMRVRRDAASALARVARPDVEAPLQSLSQDPEPQVRGAAAEALAARRRKA